MKVIVPIFFAIIISSCCEPVARNSEPMVIDTTYRDTAIKDVADRSPLSKLDSGFYPIYSIDIKNTGTESDTFTLVYERVRRNYIQPLIVREFVPAGEVRTFRTIGPVPDHGLPYTSYDVYFSFFVSTPDSVEISLMKPTVYIVYGANNKGSEECSAPPKQKIVDISRWRKD